MNEQKNYPIAHTSEDKLFTIVEKSEKEVFICVGNQLASSKNFKDLKQAKNYIARKPWELLVNVMCIVNQKMKNHETTKQ